MSNYLVHSSGPWKKHKYIRKEGKKYVYRPGEWNELNAGEGRTPDEAIRKNLKGEMEAYSLYKSFDNDERFTKDKKAREMHQLADLYSGYSVMRSAKHLREVKESTLKSKVNTLVGTTIAKGKNFVNKVSKMFSKKNISIDLKERTISTEYIKSKKKETKRF